MQEMKGRFRPRAVIDIEGLTRITFQTMSRCSTRCAVNPLSFSAGKSIRQGLIQPSAGPLE